MPKVNQRYRGLSTQKAFNFNTATDDDVKIADDAALLDYLMIAIGIGYPGITPEVTTVEEALRLEELYFEAIFDVYEEDHDGRLSGRAQLSLAMQRTDESF